MNKIKIATVFSGIGSIEFALKRLSIDHEIIFACDNGEREIYYNVDEEMNKVRNLSTINEKIDYINKLYSTKTRKINYMEKSYLENYNLRPDRFFQDIRLLDGNDFKGQVDLFVGGSPCQSFSTVGYKKGLEDARGTLFYEYARLVKEIQPKVFIYENVRNLINHDKGNTWEIIKGILQELGYNITFKVLNASDFGIPQSRRRLFVIGVKNDNNFDINCLEAKQLKFTMQDFLIDNCPDGNFTFNKKGEINVKRGTGTVDKHYELTPGVLNYVLKGGTKKFYQKPEMDKAIARTLLKTMGNHHRAGIDNYITIDEKLNRYRQLTEREAHRLMGFTDDYKIVVSKSMAYMQAGNSIVVDVLMSIIKLLVSTKVFD